MINNVYLLSFAQHVADLRVAVAAISDIVCDFVAHLKSLSYGEYPTYDYLSDLLLHASPEVSEGCAGGYLCVFFALLVLTLSSHPNITSSLN